MMIAIAVIIFFILLTIPDFPPEPDPSSLRVATANYLLTNTSHQDFVDLIDKTRPDVLVIEEYESDLEPLLNQINLVKLESVENRGTHSIAIFLKTDFIGIANVIHPERMSLCTMPYIHSRIDIYNLTVDVLGLHLPPPLLVCGHKTDESFKSIHKVINETQMDNRFSIIAGDFNSFSWSNGIHSLLNAGWTDSYDHARFFPGPTWSPSTFFPSMIRIDYIFTNQPERIKSSYHVRIPGSDHRMVITDFQLFDD
jgi:endonuclease/exonuclease/phosphatase (EEP) superfamily protein YafD